MFREIITIVTILFVAYFTSMEALASTYSQYSISLVGDGSKVRIPCEVKCDDEDSIVVINSGLTGDCVVTFAVFEYATNLQVTNPRSVSSNGRYVIEYNRYQVVKGQKYYLAFWMEPKGNA